MVKWSKIKNVIWQQCIHHSHHIKTYYKIKCQFHQRYTTITDHRLIILLCFFPTSSHLLCFFENLRFLRNFGSTPFNEGYLFLRGFLIPLRCAFTVWLCAVWFFDFAILFAAVAVCPLFTKDEILFIICTAEHRMERSSSSNIPRSIQCINERLFSTPQWHLKSFLVDFGRHWPTITNKKSDLDQPTVWVGQCRMKLATLGGLIWNA